MRGGAANSNVAASYVHTAPQGREAGQGMTAPQIFSGALVAVIIFAMDWSVRGASLLILFSSLLAVRAVDSSAAHSVVSWLSPAFSLHGDVAVMVVVLPAVCDGCVRWLCAMAVCDG
eukprot:276160-Hanusia_phi.AAC.1